MTGDAIAISMIIGLVSIIALIMIHAAGIDRRDEDRLIREWYTKGPYRAVWTTEGIRVQTTLVGVYTLDAPLSTRYETDERRAKIAAAKENRAHAARAEALELYRKRAGEEVQ